MLDPKILSTQKIWDKAEHSAFTDLIRFQDKWYCTFRESDEHVGGSDGNIRLIESSDGESWHSSALFSEPGIDLRDPKLSTTPDHQLMLLCGGSKYSKKGKYLSKQSRVAFSSDGKNWSKFTKILKPQQWLWRLTWHDGKAYGISYRSSDLDGNKLEWIATLFVSDDGINFKKITQLDIPGYPSEATLRFTDSGKMIALIRREKNAWIGSSEAPYKNWTWKDAGMHLAAPDFLIMPDQTMWASGRSIEKKSNGKITEKTVFAKMDLDRVKVALKLPSDGDTSYPGMVYHDGIFWISYYSCHQEDKSCIYLSKLKVNHKRLQI